MQFERWCCLDLAVGVNVHVDAEDVLLLVDGNRSWVARDADADKLTDVAEVSEGKASAQLLFGILDTGNVTAC